MQDELDIKVQVQRQLVEFGNYEKISAILNEKLLREGWVDKVRKMVESEFDSNSSASYADLLSLIEPKALEMVSEETKADVMGKLKAFLDDIVEVE